MKVLRQDNSTSQASATSHLTTRFRLLGIFPLIFFAAHALFYWKQGSLGHILWMCNIGNLILGLGLLLGLPMVIRVATIWLIPGLFLWAFFVVLQGGWLLTSTFAHIGGLAVGLIALSKVRADSRTWLYALAWYLFVQQICRIVTPAELNVNLAHRVYDGWQGAIKTYWEFWLGTTLAITEGVWIVGILLLKLWPPHPATQSPDLKNAGKGGLPSTLKT